MAKKSQNAKFPKLSYPWRLGAAALLVAGINTGIHVHYQNAWNQRYNQYLELHEVSAEKNLPVAKAPKYSFPNSIIYARMLEKRENDFDANMHNFSEFLKANKDQVESLWNPDYENGGYVVRAENQFEILPVSTKQNEIIKYMKEMSNGDFSNKMKLLESAKDVPHFFNPKNLPVDVGELIDLYEACFVRDSELCNNIKSYFDSVENVIGSSTTLYPLFQVDDLFAGYHTHPESPKPSDTDIATTFIAGPSLVFSKENGDLAVYALNKGKSRKIYP